MLFGEHAVLLGKTALVGAIDKYITITLIPRGDDIVHIKSSTLGEYKIELSKLKVEDNFKFVLTVIERNKAYFKCGFDLLIESGFSHTVGFGSSAAVTVATLAVLKYFVHGKMPDKLSLFYEAMAVVQSVQKMGSGADIAASIFGGILVYRRTPFLNLFIEKLPNLIPLTISYSGVKVPTTTVVKQVKNLYSKHLKVFDHIYEAMNQCALDAISAINNQEWQNLGEIMNIHQGLQDAIGVSNARLSELIFALRNRKEIKGAKISGAGLGDCVIGLGEVSDLGFEHIDASLVSKGLEYITNFTE